MNEEFEEIKSILLRLRSDYIAGYRSNMINENTPITERDIVAEIYSRIKSYFQNKHLYPHCEIKPASTERDHISKLKRLPRIDVGVLEDKGEKTWISSAIKLQDKYKKGAIESRFSSIPIEFFHTAIEVKIQSNVIDAKKDIDLLYKIKKSNKKCNCYFVLLNARGKKVDHEAIQKYADKQGITIVEYCSNQSTVMKNSRRGRIIYLLKLRKSDEEILKILNKEFPNGTFLTSNKNAISGTRRDLNTKSKQKKKNK